MCRELGMITICIIRTRISPNDSVAVSNVFPRLLRESGHLYCVDQLLFVRFVTYVKCTFRHTILRKIANYWEFIFFDNLYVLSENHKLARKCRHINRVPRGAILSLSRPLFPFDVYFTETSKTTSVSETLNDDTENGVVYTSFKLIQPFRQWIVVEHFDRWLSA